MIRLLRCKTCQKAAERIFFYGSLCNGFKVYYIYKHDVISILLLRHDLHEPQRGRGHSPLSVCFDRLRTAGFESDSKNQNRPVVPSRVPQPEANDERRSAGRIV